MTRSLVILSILTFVVLQDSVSQIDTTLKDFYPLKVGNLWQYRDQNNSLGTAQVGKSDTLLPNGQAYFGIGKPPAYSTGYGFTRLDSLLRVEHYAPYLGDTCGGRNGELNIYRLNEPVGSVWKICEDIVASMYAIWYMRYDGIRIQTIFGQPREVMRFTPGAYRAPFGDTVWYAVDWLLVKGIGIYHEETIENSYLQLTGAIIDGVTYGTVVSVDKNPISQPKSFVLHQNYPNPFNPSTTIEYELSEGTYVTLTVYDILAKEVKRLVDERQAAGRYQVRFSSSSLSTGTYIYRLTAEKDSFARVMSLVK